LTGTEQRAYEGSTINRKGGLAVPKLYYAATRSDILSWRSPAQFDTAKGNKNTYPRHNLPLLVYRARSVIRGLRIYRKSGIPIRLALILLSGVGLALAFPKVGLNWVAWITLIPLLIAIDRQPLPKVLAYAWAQGLVFYAIVFYWIEIEFHDYVHWSVVTACGPLLLLTSLAAVSTAATFFVAEFVRRSSRISVMIVLPAAWVAIEWLRSFFPVGNAWDFLGCAAYRDLNTIQFAEFTGVYGVSALIVLVNATTYWAITERLPRHAKISGGAVVAGIILTIVGFGTARRIQLSGEQPSGQIKVAMVQGNIPQTVKWDPAALPSTLKVYFDSTEAAARSGADLVIWPETATSFLFQPNDAYPYGLNNHREDRERLLELANNIHKPILFGAPAIYLHRGASVRNRAYLVSDEGQIAGYYDKIQLVPFGEYIPAKWVVGRYVHHILVESIGEFTPGDGPVVFDVDGAHLGVLICYESLFPDLARHAVGAGADILVNLTNDAWYGDSSAPYQLLAMAVMRAVENHKPLVRVGNTGVSAVITPTGEIVGATKIFTRVTEIQTVSWTKGHTFYTEHGDVFAHLCFMLVVGCVLVALGQTLVNAGIPWGKAPSRNVDLDDEPSIMR
jgi:apolipoprotein N-acyltransferase